MKPFEPGHIDDDGFDMMFTFLMMGKQKANYPALKELCLTMRRMMTQKNGGYSRHRKSKDVHVEGFEQVWRGIVIETMALVLSGEWERRCEDMIHWEITSPPLADEPVVVTVVHPSGARYIESGIWSSTDRCFYADSGKVYLQDDILAWDVGKPYEERR